MKTNKLVIFTVKLWLNPAYVDNFWWNVIRTNLGCTSFSKGRKTINVEPSKNSCPHGSYKNCVRESRETLLL